MAMAVSSVLASLDQRISMQMESFEGRDRHEYRSTQVSSNVKTKTTILQKTVSAWNKIFKIFSARAHTIKRKTQSRTIMNPKDTPPRVHKIIMCENPNTPAGNETTPLADDPSQEPQLTQRQPPTLNTTNLKTNTTYGTVLQLPKPKSISRFVSLNINGFRQGKDFQDTLEIAQALKVSSADMWNFQETNVNWRSSCLGKCYEKFRKIYHHARIATSSSIITYRTLYQPGGTMCAVTDDYVGRVIETGSDTDMGRWSYIRLLGKYGRNIVLVSVYQVCNQQASTAGDRTVFAQQTSLLRRNGKDCSPRKSFFDDLDKQLEEWRNNGYEIILSGDLNEELGADVDGFARLSAKWNLVEIIQHFHGTTNEPPTYARGTRRLDYVFCTTNLLPSVTKCGILPYSEILDSDHRALYVDFDTKTLMGGDLAILSATPVRILKSTDTKGREKYVEHVAKYMEEHRVLQRLMEVSEATEPNTKKIEAIDRDISRAMAHAIKLIRKVYASPFSPQIKQARLRRRFYKLHLSIQVNNLDLHSQLENLSKELDDDLPTPANIDEARQLLRDAQKNVRKITAQAAEIRITHLEEQANNMDNIDDEKAALIRKRIIKAEEVKSMYMKLRRYMNPQGRSNINHVMVPADNLPPKLAQLWRSVYDPVVLEALIIERNKKHFAQAKDTPFTKDILGMIPFSGTGPIADSILAGTMKVDDPIVQLVLDNLKKPAGLIEIPATITLEDVKGKFENWKESTSTSPITKRHLGHYQCLTRLVDLEEDDEKPNPAIARAKKILQAHFLIISTAVKFGISLTRWQNVVNSMIEKEPGNPRIHRLRVIHLYEADYNLTLGVFWARKLVPTAEKQRLFHPSCYGGRPGMSAIDPVFLEELQVSISYLSRTNQVTFHNDATSCYDRIIIALANLVARRFGMPEEIARLHGSTLEQMRYYVSTAMGISEASYTHSEDSPVYGTGQGSCASPSVWLQICSILFDCHDQRSYGANYCTPDGKTKFKRSMTGFVDDTKGQTNDLIYPEPMPLQQLIARMQADAQLWGDLLHVTGGALEIPKCNYYVMEWKFQPSGIPKLNSHVDTVLHLQNGDRTAIVTLKNDAITVAHKTLGTWKSAARDQVKQANVLEEKSNLYARTIMASPFTRVDNWTSYSAIYLPKMTYVLPTSYLPEKRLHKIEKRAVAATLSKGGFVSSFSRAVANGPHLYGGIAMRPLLIEQLVEQTKTIIKHLRCPGEGHDLLHITLSWAQLGTGVGFPLLESPNIPVPQLECEWLQSVRTGLSSIEARIECHHPFVYKPRRAEDSHIMDAIGTSKSFTATEMKRINACRLYLKVMLVSDISTPCGKRIIRSYYKGNIESRINWPAVIYPRQNRPDKKSWTVWRRALHLVYLRADKHLLKVPLGKWHPAETYHHKWKWNYGQDALYYQSQDRSFLGYPEHSFARRHFQFHKTGVEVTGIPNDSFPVEVHESHQYIQVPFKQIFPLPHRREPNYPEQLRHRIKQLPTSLRQLVNNIETLVTEEEIEACLERQEPIYIASDGGAIPGRASFGWILQIGNTQIAKGKGPAYGDDPRSFRAEGYGMASALVYLRLIKQHFQFTRQKGSKNTIICDNEGLLIRIEEASSWNYTTPNVTLRAEWDIESVILSEYKAIDTQFVFMHVMSHQDDSADVASLPLESRLNVEADRLATAYMVEDKTLRPTAILFESAKAQLIIKEVSITRKIPQAIRFAAGSKEIRTYLMKRNTWNMHTMDDVNWEAHGASHSFHRPHRCYLVKMCHRHLPIGQTLNRRDHKYPATCPGCRLEPETQQHYLQCLAPSRIAWRLKLLTSLRKQMESLQTDPNLVEVIINCMDKSMSDRAIIPAGQFRKAIKAQSHIGWLAMLRGYWSLEWQQAYEKTHPTPDSESRKERNKRQRKMKRWQKKVIQNTWGSMISLWKTRNDERHGRDKESRDSARREVLHKELEDLYNRKNEYPARVQRLLRDSYEVHIQETVTKIADWLDAYKGTFNVTWSPD